MELKDQKDAVPGTVLQNGQGIQQGGSTNGLQQQNNYKQLSRDALSDEAFNNYKGLTVQDALGNVPPSMPANTSVDSGYSWPIILLLVTLCVCALAWMAIVKRMRGNYRRKRSGAVADISDIAVDAEAPTVISIVPSESAELISPALSPKSIVQYSKTKKIKKNSRKKRR